MRQTPATATAAPPAPALHYGLVRIVRGRHKGKLGYYDDDENGYALVYLGAPFASPIVLVRYSSLVPCDDPYPPLDDWLRMHADVAAVTGVHR
jgi:hypothetical protein